MNETQSTDWDTINDYLHTIKDVQGIASTYSYNGTPMLSTSEFVVQIVDGASKVITVVKS